MNLLVLSAIAAGALGVLWLGQSVVLLWIDQPLAWPMRFDSRQPAARQAGKILVPTIWVLVILLAPHWLGSSLEDYYGPMLVRPAWRPIVFSVVFIVAGFATLHVVGRMSGYIRPFREHAPEKIRGKLLRRIFVVPIPAALVEELVFRCLILKQLLVGFPATTAGMIAALIISSAIFGSVHFVAARPAGTPVWQEACGIFMVGCAIGAGYIHAGEVLWLPLAIHASGIACVEAPKLFTRFERRGRWLIGTRDFPYAGVQGWVMLLLLAASLLLT
jgi:membrane protease YdiL (CAAX protease family)